MASVRNVNYRGVSVQQPENSNINGWFIFVYIET